MSSASRTPLNLKLVDGSLTLHADNGIAPGPVVVQQQSLRRAAALQQPSSSDTTASTTAQAPSEWDTNVIFNGNRNGRLDPCPADSSNWPATTWVQETGGKYNSGGYMLPHSAHVQELIRQHQNPADCSTAKFILYRNPRMGEGSHGVGSLLHLETVMLLLALNSGRVLAEVPGTYLTDHPYCGNRTTVDTCYFEPLTHCKITPEQIASAYMLNGTAKSGDQMLFTNGQTDSLPQFISADKLFPQRSTLVHTVPTAFRDLLKDSGIPMKNEYYWWRAQAIAYVVRPNAQALQELAVRKRWAPSQARLLCSQ